MFLGISVSSGMYGSISSAHGEIAPCTSNASFIEPEKLRSVSGAVSIDVSTENSAASVRLELGEKIIGNAQSINGDRSLWRMEWDTRYSPSGEYILVAEVTYVDGTTCELQYAGRVGVSNSVILNIGAITQPNSWRGQVGESTQFQAQAVPSDQADAIVDVTQYADIVWLTTQVGTFADSTMVSSQFKASSEPTQGKVVAFVNYGGSSASASIDVEVYEESSSTASQTPISIAGVLVAIGVLIRLILLKQKKKRRR